MLTKVCTTIVLILDSNPGSGAHGRSDLGYLTCLGHLFGSRAVTIMKRPIFLHACTKCSELPSYIDTIVAVVSLWKSLKK